MIVEYIGKIRGNPGKNGKGDMHKVNRKCPWKNSSARERKHLCEKTQKPKKNKI